MIRLPPGNVSYINHTGGIQITSVAALEDLDLHAGIGGLSDVYIFLRNMQDTGTVVYSSKIPVLSRTRYNISLNQSRKTRGKPKQHHGIKSDHQAAGRQR